tara:strand:+ start:640 stop:1395 length:756 start_codon:yes stop_codon:yes gene_type:complete
MDIKSLDSINLTELKKIAKNLDISHVYKLNKTQLKNDIIKKLKKIEQYEIREREKYKIIRKLGTSGKEATTYLVHDKNNKILAKKQYRKNKSINNIKTEIKLQNKANTYGISPKIIDYNYDYKYVIMEKLDETLFDILKENKGGLDEKYQQMIINIIYVLDRIGIFHGDPNLGNFMIKRGKKDKMYIIDFGFSKEITPRLISKFGTSTPNQKFMLVGLLLKIKEITGKINLNHYKIFKKYLSSQDKDLFKI